MCHPALRFACALAATAVVAFAPARGTDTDAIKENLFKAKKAYDEETQKFRAAVGEYFDKREDEARKSGNKKGVDQVKIDRDRFEQAGDLPPGCPKGPIAQAAAARTKLDGAYDTAVKEFTRLKEDAAAAATEKEQQEFLFSSAFITGRRTHLGNLKPTKIQVWNNWFERDSNKYTMGAGPVPHSVFMHPDARNVATVSYVIPPKATAFRASLGVPKHANDQGDPACPLTFEVLGDGKSLWKSEPVAALNAFQTCAVKLDKVKTLTLKVHCPDAHGGAHAVWFGPFVVE